MIMETQYIEYKVSSPFFYLNSPINVMIENVKINIETAKNSQEDEELIIRFEFFGDCQETHKQISEQLLEKLLDKLSFEFNLQLGNPYITSLSIAGQKTISNRMQGKYRVVYAPDQSSIDKLLSFFLTEVKDHTYLRMFRYALKNNDPVDRFMFLYSILALLKGNQVRIDSFIRRTSYYNKEENMKSGNPRRNTDETIFTWLRNQVGHVDQETDISFIRKKIQEKLSDLTEIVKISIQQKIGS
jgi:hypothetical protein